MLGWPTVPDLAPVPDFFSCFVQIFYVFPCVVESSDLSTRKQHDPTKVCRDEAALGAIHHRRRLRSPCCRPLTTFVVTLAVVATMFLAVEVALVIDCCVPSPPEEDQHLPSPSGKVPPWPSLP
jgi:hypothetical protein